MIHLWKLEPERARVLKLRGTASSIISVGLNWKMAIGACVLGNTIMGLVITINGRMGATVGRVLSRAELSLLGIASHSVRRSRTHAIWLLL